jgi:hypothetical protein
MSRVLFAMAAVLGLAGVLAPRGAAEKEKGKAAVTSREAFARLKGMTGEWSAGVGVAAAAVDGRVPVGLGRQDVSGARAPSKKRPPFAPGPGPATMPGTRAARLAIQRPNPAGSRRDRGEAEGGAGRRRTTRGHRAG